MATKKKRAAKKKPAAKKQAKKKGASKKTKRTPKKGAAKKQRAAKAAPKKGAAKKKSATSRPSTRSSSARAGKGAQATRAKPTSRRTAGGLSAAADLSMRALSPSRIVLKVGIQREEGYVYFVDPADMNIWRFPDSVDDDVRMNEERELVFDTGLPRDPAFADERVLYYLDKDGDVAVTDVVRA